MIRIIIVNKINKKRMVLISYNKIVLNLIITKRKKKRRKRILNRIKIVGNKKVKKMIRIMIAKWMTRKGKESKEPRKGSDLRCPQLEKRSLK